MGRGFTTHHLRNYWILCTKLRLKDNVKGKWIISPVKVRYCLCQIDDIHSFPCIVKEDRSCILVEKKGDNFMHIDENVNLGVMCL